MASSPSSSSSSSPPTFSAGIPVVHLQEHIDALRHQLSELESFHPDRAAIEREIRMVQQSIDMSYNLKPPSPPPPPPQPSTFSNYQQPLGWRETVGGGTSIPDLYSGNGAPYYNTNSDGRNNNGMENSSWNLNYELPRPAKRPRGDSSYLGLGFPEREIKSQRTTPSPATSNTPLSELGSISPHYGHEQNGYGDGSDNKVLDAANYTAGNETEKSDEELARNLQKFYNEGHPTPERRPNTNRTDFLDNHQSHLPGYGPASQPGHSHNQPGTEGPRNVFGSQEIIDLSSDDDEVTFLKQAPSEPTAPIFPRIESGQFADGALVIEDDAQPLWHYQPSPQQQLPVHPSGPPMWYETMNAVLNGAGNPSHSSAYDQDLLYSDPSSRIVDKSTGRILNDPYPTVDPNGTYLNPALQYYADYVRHDPTKTRDEIKALLENIRPDMEIPPESREGTPDAMVYPLMEHQKLGLAWLKQMEEGSNKGGILADDMGLGKTIQALALIVARPSKEQKNKTTLIIAPVALLKQWEREIDKKLKKDHKLSVCVFHGAAKKAKSYKDLASFDVVLTTFGTIASEFKRNEKYLAELNEHPESQPPKLLFIGETCRWYRVVIDEAQCIKNKDTQSSRGCQALHAKYRLCLSGTPMQNSCDELFSLLRFLRIKPYNDWSSFSKEFARPLKGRYEHAVNQALQKLQALLKAILLRRTKDSKIDGQPILSLPPKTIEMVHAVFSPDEQEFYLHLENKSKIVYSKYLRANTVGKNYSNLLVLLLRLRQACCHPHLINDIEDSSSEEMFALAKELAPEAVTRIKELDAHECPVCLDVSENPTIIIPCGHEFCSECLLRVQNQHEQSELARGDENSKPRCPGCRGELNPKKLIDLKTFKKVHQPESLEEVKEEALAEPPVDDGLIYDTDSDDEVDSNGDLRGFVVRDEEDGEERKPNKDEPKSKTKTKGKGKEKAKVGRTLAEVKKDAMKNEKSRRQYHRYLSKRWVDSAKVTKCVEICDEIARKDPTEKTIVFSQFTSLLDLLEVPMSAKKWEYRRYDGSMTAQKRNQALVDFQDDPEVKIVLVSLKAGNAGLNLVAASQVIIFDPFYNPFIEFQAIDRAHRIGQQRPVIVHRLIVPGTVEDRVLNLQEKKRKLIEDALDEGASKGVARLTAKEIGFLFGI